MRPAGRLPGTAALALVAIAAACVARGALAPPAAAQDTALPTVTPPPATPAADKPLVEAGGIVAGAVLPDYPASDESHVRFLPVPFLIYRGEVLRSDEWGLRGRFVRTGRLELDVSLGGSLPTSSDDNEAREDMPDLELMGEIGPSLRVNLLKDPGRGRLDLELNLRAVFTTDLAGVTDFTYRGLVLAPEVGWRRADLLRPGTRLRIGAGPIFATDRYMDYFYAVEPRFERPGRPEYDADPGYLGTRVQGSFTVPITGWLSVFAGGRLDLFSGATNDGSPLFERELNAAGIAGVSFSAYQSKARVPVQDDTFE